MTLNEKATKRRQSVNARMVSVAIQAFCPAQTLVQVEKGEKPAIFSCILPRALAIIVAGEPINPNSLTIQIMNL